MKEKEKAHLNVSYFIPSPSFFEELGISESIPEEFAIPVIHSQTVSTGNNEEHSWEDILRGIILVLTEQTSHKDRSLYRKIALAIRPTIGQDLFSSLSQFVEEHRLDRALETAHEGFALFPGHLQILTKEVEVLLLQARDMLLFERKRDASELLEQIERGLASLLEANEAPQELLERGCAVLLLAGRVKSAQALAKNLSEESLHAEEKVLESMAQGAAFLDGIKAEQALALFKAAEPLSAILQDLLPYSKALALLQLGQIEEAQKIAKEGLTLYPESDLLFCILGLICLERKETEKAKELFSIATVLSPSNTLAQKSLKLL